MTQKKHYRPIVKKIFMVLIFDNKTILTCYIYLQNNMLVKYFYYISWKFLITLCVGITFRNDFLLHFAHLVPLHFVKILYYIMRRYYISQQFFITSSVGITFRNDLLLRFGQELHFARILYYVMRRHYISQQFCITLCVGITFRNVYYIMRFNTRASPAYLSSCEISLGSVGSGV